MWLVPAEINGRLTLDFMVDSGATTVSVNAEVFAALKRAGTIKEADVLGPQTFTQADGSQYRADIFLIKSIKVGNVVIENVKASVAPSNTAPLLLGQSFLQRFNNWSIDNAAKVLVLETAHSEKTPAPPVDAPKDASPTPRNKSKQGTVNPYGCDGDQACMKIAEETRCDAACQQECKANRFDYMACFKAWGPKFEFERNQRKNQ